MCVNEDHHLLLDPLYVVSEFLSDLNDVIVLMCVEGDH